jgi:hypothetical protein
MERVGHELGAKTIEIALLDAAKIEEPKDTSPIDVATEIFG